MAPLKSGIFLLLVALAWVVLIPPATTAAEIVNHGTAGLGAGGRTELMDAARRGDYERVQSLLEAGADVNQANRNGGTPLMYAALGGNPRVVALLLGRGGEANATASNGWGPLMIAAAKGYDGIVRQLLKQGADPNHPDVYRWTPLMRAVYERRLRVAEILLQDPRTEVNQRGENDTTALHLAVARGHPGLVELLLQNGARRNIEDGLGRTAYALAAQSGQTELMQLLKE